MATRLAVMPGPVAGDTRFFMQSAFAMAAVIIAGFSLQLAMGRSSFASPLLVHAHAIVFMGWLGIYVAQNVLAARGSRAWHRRLGWVAAAWILAMLALGTMVTLAIVRRGQVPFFFRPQHFLIFDPMSLVAFVGLTIAAIKLRKRTDWHRRLHFCAMSLLLGPGFGRLLPMPLLAPWAWEASFAATLLFPLAGIIADRRRGRGIHPAWGWGVGTMVTTLLLIEVLSYSAAGNALYRAVTAGTPGATVDALAFAAPPADGRVTGRTTN